MLQNLDCGTKSWRSLTPPCTPYLCSAAVTSVEFANDNTLISADSSGKTKVWNIATGEEKTEALAGSKFALSKGKGDRKKQQVVLRRAHEAPRLLLAVVFPLFRERELGASQRLRLLFSSRDVPHPRLATAVCRHQRVVINEFHARDGVTAQARRRQRAP